MKLSIAIITYNQESYIAQAIDSVLMQDVDFDYEIVIGEDCSKDSTRQILLDYQVRYPEKIRLLLHETNLGSQRNFATTIMACKGQYIALLEGDDYWRSPLKLQKQVSYLDAHPECAICSHPVALSYDADLKENEFWPKRKPKQTSMLSDLLFEDYIPTCSTVFRNALFGPFPDWFYDLKIGDWPLHILNSEHGNIAFLDEPMGVYRIHNGGIWSRIDAVAHMQQIEKVYDAINAHLDYRFDRVIKANLFFHWARAFNSSGEYGKARAYALKSITKRPFGQPASGLALRLLLRLCLPIPRKRTG